MKGYCFLFGHRDTPYSVLPQLIQAIEEEVSRGTALFYVGYHGSFDRLAATALRKVKAQHREITLMLVLPYHPGEQAIPLPEGFDGSFYPPLQGVPRQYAIIKANQYMVSHGESVLCYVRHTGNTRSLLEYAHRRKGLSIVNLAEKEAAPKESTC